MINSRIQLIIKLTFRLITISKAKFYSYVALLAITRRLPSKRNFPILSVIVIILALITTALTLVMAALAAAVIKPSYRAVIL